MKPRVPEATQLTQRVQAFIKALFESRNITPNEVQQQMLASHVRAMVHRSLTGEPLQEVEESLFEEISTDSLDMAKAAVEQFGNLPVEEVDFYPSVVEREAIISTVPGEGVALPHSLGLMANKTVGYTVLAPKDLRWGDETAHVIFLRVISKSEYEEAMAIYDLFVTFLRDKAMPRLRDSQNFEALKQWR